MKIYDSGMPEEDYWNTLFDIPLVLKWLHLESITGPVAEFGSGYGTFTVPIAQATHSTVYAFDIDPEMIRVANLNARAADVQNLVFECRDILQQGTGLSSNHVGMVLAFNILHSPQNAEILAEASRILRPRGRIAVIHWRKDVPTPRGPEVSSRPDHGAIIEAIKGLDLRIFGHAEILQPHHWGIQLLKDGT